MTSVLTPGLRLAVAQLALRPDPGDAAQIRSAGEDVRSLMRSAAAAGARVALFPEGALSCPAKGLVSVRRPEPGPADWSLADWAGLRSELAETARLAADLELWTVVGGVHLAPREERPTNCLYVISDLGLVVARYDERMLSRTKSTWMYAAGSQPLTFTADGVRFGLAMGMETHYAEIFAAYEELDVDAVLFGTHGSPETPGVFAVEAAGHAAANSLWVAYAGPAADGHPASGVLTPEGEWVARCEPGTAGIAVAEVVTGQASPARAWRRTARAGLRG